MFFYEMFLYTQKAKTQFCLRIDFKKAQILRALLSNKNGILHSRKESIIQHSQNGAQIY